MPQPRAVKASKPTRRTDTKPRKMHLDLLATFCDTLEDVPPDQSENVVVEIGLRHYTVTITGRENPQHDLT